MIGNKPQHQVDTWNKRVEVGITVIEFRPYPAAAKKQYRTRSPAYLLNGHSPVVELEGKAGTVDINCCKVFKGASGEMQDFQ
ncbi:hypothetical protein [Pseudomonas serbica]|jgi:hypothetical protein|uniref:hypothetical protein n=1 Tax=Pseudomonas serbica TaxID=2965074 RepID=UPI00237B4764|nr:hypothetical protein [Pseudomonas serbica]